LKLSENKLKWATPVFNENEQPHFLFIITPPYSGSTALSELLNTSYRTMILQERAEGQWLIPGLCEKDRWNQDKKVDYDSVKATWLSRFQMVQRLTGNVDVVIEKSPPNMMRIEELASQFNSYSFIANNRNPYANCASILYRQHDAKAITSKQRKSILKDLTKKWMEKSQRIRELIEKLNIPLLTYEDFCKKPSSVIDILNLPKGVAESINTEAKVKVKDYKPQKISNQNDRQISNLTPEEIKLISSILESNTQLLEFFNYEVI